VAAPRIRHSNRDGIPPCYSRWRLWHDLAWAHALLWVASVGRPVSPLPGVHLYFADRYTWLAKWYEGTGRLNKAEAYWELAQWHIEAAGPGPDEPVVAAMAMAIPPAPVNTDARSDSGSFPHPTRLHRIWPLSSPTSA